MLLALVLVAQIAKASPVPQQVTIQTGRFQIVNPTPDRSNQIILLDTQTGRTWLLVECPSKRETGVKVPYSCWGEMERYDDTEPKR